MKNNLKKIIALLGSFAMLFSCFDTQISIASANNNPLADKKIQCVSINSDNCGIVTTDGELYTWGFSDFNQLGRIRSGR